MNAARLSGASLRQPDDFHPGISALLVMIQVDQASCFRLLERG